MIEIYNSSCFDWFLNNQSTFNLIYIDPPYNSNKTQKRATDYQYSDKFSKNNSSDKQEQMTYEEFIKSACRNLYDILEEDGSFFIQADYREIHYIKVWLDEIFGRNNFMNEIIWSYDYGGRSKKVWPTKHDTILWYAKNPNNYIWNYDAIDRLPYKAPSLCGPEKAKIGKVPTDVWDIPIVHTNGKEKTGYPTQKPSKLLDRIISVHSNENDRILDIFGRFWNYWWKSRIIGKKFCIIG